MCSDCPSMSFFTLLQCGQCNHVLLLFNFALFDWKTTFWGGDVDTTQYKLYNLQSTIWAQDKVFILDTTQLRPLVRIPTDPKSNIDTKQQNSTTVLTKRSPAWNSFWQQLETLYTGQIGSPNGFWFSGSLSVPIAGRSDSAVGASPVGFASFARTSAPCFAPAQTHHFLRFVTPHYFDPIFQLFLLVAQVLRESRLKFCPSFGVADSRKKPL